MIPAGRWQRVALGGWQDTQPFWHHMKTSVKGRGQAVVPVPRNWLRSTKVWRYGIAERPFAPGPGRKAWAAARLTGAAFRYLFTLPSVCHALAVFIVRP